MSEIEWHTCTDPDQLMTFLKSSGRATERKLRLHLAAVCRFLRHRIMDERSREAVRIAEDYADGFTNEKRLTEASQRAHHVLMEETLRRSPASTLQAVYLACVAAGKATDLFPIRVPLDRQVRVSLIHEIFSTTSIDSRLISDTVLKLAQGCYEARDPITGFLDNTRLGVLADSLEDVGCTDASLLDHLRGPGPHARGCWALDAVLGKA